MAMRNPYAAYKQQTRISENKKALKNLQGQAKESEAKNTKEAISNIATEETAEVVTEVASETATESLVEILPSNLSRFSNQKDVKTIQKENPYLFNTVMTASSGDLVLLLYGGAVKFMKQAISYMKDNKASEANHVNQRAQAIFEELMCTLDMEGQPEMSQQLYKMYEFINYSLVEANIKKDPELIEKMIEFTNELRTTWQEAIQSTKKKKTSN